MVQTLLTHDALGYLVALGLPCPHPEVREASKFHREQLIAHVRQIVNACCGWRQPVCVSRQMLHATRTPESHRQHLPSAQALWTG